MCSSSPALFAEILKAMSSLADTGLLLRTRASWPQVGEVGGKAGWAAGWPATREALLEAQEALGRVEPDLWQPSTDTPLVGACFVCFERGRAGAGMAGDRGWGAACLWQDGQTKAIATVRGSAGGPYAPGLLALREGPLLERAVRALPRLPELLLVNATGRDHPRRAGLALHLGAVLGVPTVGVTHRPLVASGAWPPDLAGQAAPLLLDGEVVGCWLRTRAHARPLAVHAAWRIDAGAALDAVKACLRGARTPEPLRLAREAARSARAGSAGRLA